MIIDSECVYKIYYTVVSNTQMSCDENERNVEILTKRCNLDNKHIVDIVEIKGC